MTNRETDIRVAKAIGWTEIQEASPLDIEWAGIDPETGLMDDIPHFTRDIAAAWTLVEKLRAMGWRERHERYADDRSEWSLFHKSGCYAVVKSTAPTDEQAIADAALQILEKEKKDE